MPLEKGQAPLEKGQTYIEHFPAREDALLISHVKSIQTTYCHFDRAATSGEIFRHAAGHVSGRFRAPSRAPARVAARFGPIMYGESAPN